MWQALLAVFACRNATVHEEAMLAAGALTYACGPQFVKYMERFFPVLQMGLTNHQARPYTVERRPVVVRPQAVKCAARMLLTAAAARERSPGAAQHPASSMAEPTRPQLRGLQSAPLPLLQDHHCPPDVLPERLRSEAARCCLQGPRCGNSWCGAAGVGSA